MKQKVFWVTQDEDGKEVLLWTKMPKLDDNGCWWGRGKNTEPDFSFCFPEFRKVTGIKLKLGGIKKFQIEVVPE